MKKLVGILYLTVWRAQRALSRFFSGRLRTPRPDSTNLADVDTIRHRVLVVSPLSIHPMIHGGAVRMGNLIRQMSTWCDVSAFVFIGGTDDPEQRRALEPWCEDIFFQQFPSDNEQPDDPWAVLPRSAVRLASPLIAERLTALINAHGYNIVHLEYTEMGYYLRACPAARTILTEHDLSFTSHSRQRAIGIGARFGATDLIGAGGADALRQRRFEFGACERADQVHVMSAVDRDLLAPHLCDGASRIRVVPNGVDCGLFNPPPNVERRDVLFLGSFPHLPNLDAFEFLVAEVWPAVRQLHPKARITVVGARPPDSVREWDGRDGITVLGEVPEVAPLYHSHRVMVVPLRAGSGTRLKILEALASGLPVVSTTIGVEGIELSDPPEVRIADTPHEIARSLVDLLCGSDDEITQIGMRGRLLAASRYDWSVVSETLRTAHNDLLRGSQSPLRRVRSNLAESPTTAKPDVSIIVPVGACGSSLTACLDGISRQQTSRRVEVLCIDWGSTADEEAAMHSSGARIVAVDGGRFDQGETVNTGANAARGEVLVFISPHAVPTDDHWLELVTAPFTNDRPPSAVQGGVVGHRSPCPPFSDPNLGKETRQWINDHGGFAFSIVNAAIRRDVWERFPFHPGPLFEDRKWQRLVQTNGHLILPCYAAAVHYARRLGAIDLLRMSSSEGSAWRFLGVRCRLLIPPDSSAHRGRANRLRLLGMYLGNRRLAPWLAACGPV